MLPSLVRTWFGGDVPLRRLSDDRAAAWGSHRDFLPSRLVATGLLKGLYGSGWLTPHLPVEAMRWNSVVAIALGCSGQVLSQEAITTVPVLSAVPQRDYLAGDYDGRRTRLYDKGTDLFANYQGEVFGNVTGGAVLDSSGHSKQVAVYDGLLTSGANLDLTKLTGWWPGAKLSFSVLGMHGSNLSTSFC